MLAFMNNALLKPHPEFLYHTPYQCPRYFYDFMTNKIFKFIPCLRPTFKDLSPQVSSEKVSIYITPLPCV